MKVHDLKCWPVEFRASRDGLKPFEVRKDDREFEDGDIVILREFVPEEMVGTRIVGASEEYGFKYTAAGYTGSVAGPFKIGYVTRCGAIPKGWCGFSLIRLVEATQ